MAVYKSNAFAFLQDGVMILGIFYIAFPSYDPKNFAVI